ncbi:UDP-glucose 4-epimerase family protein [Pseudomonas syringae]|nr:SDR family oxidoreductase [Pseudomonas syringae]
MTDTPVSIIAVTGATGFVGSAVVRQLSDQRSCRVRAAVRRNDGLADARIEVVNVGDLAPDNQWQALVQGCDVVIHCAARVHVLNDSTSDPEAEYFRANVAATLNLARQAAQAGVKRFIFISSIKVNGEHTQPGLPFRADDRAAPLDPYGASKQAAEEGLRELAVRTAMEVVIVRPVLVYGPGVKANFRNMMRWLDKGIPLPLGAIDNRRSLVALGNLVDLVIRCIDHPNAANQTFLVSDGHDLSTTQLLQRMACALGKPARLLPVPMNVLTGLARMLGKRAFSQRLCGSLQVDIEKTCTLLDWTPPVGIDEAMNETAAYFLEHKRHA